MNEKPSGLLGDDRFRREGTLTRCKPSLANTRKTEPKIFKRHGEILPSGVCVFIRINPASLLCAPDGKARV